MKMFLERKESLNAKASASIEPTNRQKNKQKNLKPPKRNGQTTWKTKEVQEKSNLRRIS